MFSSALSLVCAVRFGKQRRALSLVARKVSAVAVLATLSACSSGDVNLPSQQAIVLSNSVTLFAAGSLKKALTEVSAAYEARTGNAVVQTYGSSGLLRHKIEAGAQDDVFASADVGNPQTLNNEGRSGAVQVFTHNRLCLLAKASVVNGRSVANIMLDPAVRLATSTPKADPSGDYAETIFSKIDAERPGSRAILDAKALRLVGGPTSPPIPSGQDTGVYLLLTSNQADVFLSYCSGTIASAALAPQTLVSIEMPSDLAVRADYGVTILNGARKNSQAFVQFLFSDQAQAILVKYGFSPYNT